MHSKEKPSLELLISVMNSSPEECIEKMHLASDAVIINQCDRQGYEEINIPGGIVRFFSNTDRGVGRSRNEAIVCSTGAILLFSDEDIEYFDGYEEKILSEFEKNPRVDMIFFNVEVCEERRTYYNDKEGPVGLMNCGRYPAYSIAVRAERLKETRIKYDLDFGGGAKYSCGEDSIFIRDCIRAGMKARKSTALLGRENPRPSTWFVGYTDKFFYDRGVLYKRLYGSMALIWVLQFVIRKKEFVKECGRLKAFRNMMSGLNGEDIIFDKNGAVR